MFLFLQMVDINLIMSRYLWVLSPAGPPAEINQIREQWAKREGCAPHLRDSIDPWTSRRCTVISAATESTAFYFLFKCYSFLSEWKVAGRGKECRWSRCLLRSRCQEGGLLWGLWAWEGSICKEVSLSHLNTATQPMRTSLNQAPAMVKGQYYIQVCSFIQINSRKNICLFCWF